MADRTKQTNAASLSGYRAPTPEEVVGVARIMTKYYISGVKLCMFVSIAFALTAFLMCWAVSVIGRAALYICVIASVGGIYTLSTRTTFERNCKVFAKGDFKVLDGFVSEIGGNDKPGFCNVIFTSASGQKLNGYCAVRQEGLALQTPLILVYVSNDRIRNGIVWAFTPFMLTPEAANLRW